MTRRVDIPGLDHLLADHDARLRRILFESAGAWIYVDDSLTSNILPASFKTHDSPPFLNGWGEQTNNTYFTGYLRFRWTKENGLEIQGCVANGYPGTAVFQLPSWLWPSEEMVIPGSDHAYSMLPWRVDTSGFVYCGLTSRYALRVDATAQAYGTVSFTMPGGGCWLYYRVRYSAAVLNGTWANGSQIYAPDSCLLGAVGGTHDFLAPIAHGTPTPWDWNTYNGDTGVVNAMGADGWYTAEAHWDGTTITWYVNSIQIASYAPGAGIVAAPFNFGALVNIASLAADSYIYLQDIRIGTTRAATDIAAVDFSTGDLTQFSSDTNPSRLAIVGIPF